jgi:hypothetical protein
MTLVPELASVELYYKSSVSVNGGQLGEDEG